MKKTSIDYFQSEINYLNQAAKDFAHDYPQYAKNLNLDGGYDRDPNVERLLNGCAFLTAQIRQ
jgi:type VI secretion system protein ImpG